MILFFHLYGYSGLGQGHFIYNEFLEIRDFLGLSNMQVTNMLKTIDGYAQTQTDMAVHTCR